jgi:hypothetical protein
MSFDNRLTFPIDHPNRERRYRGVSAVAIGVSQVSGAGHATRRGLPRLEKQDLPCFAPQMPGHCRPPFSTPAAIAPARVAFAGSWRPRTSSVSLAHAPPPKA